MGKSAGETGREEGKIHEEKFYRIANRGRRRDHVVLFWSQSSASFCRRKLTRNLYILLPCDEINLLFSCFRLIVETNCFVRSRQAGYWENCICDLKAKKKKKKGSERNPFFFERHTFFNSLYCRAVRKIRSVFIMEFLSSYLRFDMQFLPYKSSLRSWNITINKR